MAAIVFFLGRNREFSSLVRTRQLMDVLRSPPPLFSRAQPWLVFTHGDEYQKQTFFSPSENRYYNRIIPELQNKFIRNFHNGWLLLEDYLSDEITLLNIVSMEKVQLPPLLNSASFRLLSCLLSSSPTDPTCRVMFFDRDDDTIASCKPGDDSFVRQNIEFDDDGMFLLHAVMFKGKIYGLVYPGYKLQTADFTEPSRFSQVPMDLGDIENAPDGYTHDFYLIECCGEILFINMTFSFRTNSTSSEVSDFIIFRADFSQSKWVRVTSIGDNAIFIRDYNGFSCAATESGVRANTIYFSYHGDRNLHSYNLEEQSFSISLPCPIVSSYDHQLCWIMIPATTNANLSHTKACIENMKLAVSIPPVEEYVHDELDRSWSGLLPDLLSLIRSHLYAGDFVTFKSICKSWFCAPPPLQLPPPATMTSSLSQSLCLIFLNNNRLFHPICNAFYHHKNLEPTDAFICDGIVCDSKYGWFLMTRDMDIFFFNPITKVRIPLPKIPTLNSFCRVCFSSPPTSLECRVIGISRFRVDEFQLSIINRNEESWTVNEFKYERNFDCAFCNSILYKGLHYFMGMQGNFLIYDPKNRQCRWTGCDMHLRRRLDKKFHRSYMVESDGKVLGVFVASDGHWVGVFQLNQSSPLIWQEVKSLGNKMIFVSSPACYIETAVVKGTGNKIYLPKFHGKDGLFYCLATKKLYTFAGDYCSDSFDDTIEYRNSTWIKPVFDTACAEVFIW